MTDITSKLPPDGIRYKLLSMVIEESKKGKGKEMFEELVKMAIALVVSLKKPKVYRIAVLEALKTMVEEQIQKISKEEHDEWKDKKTFPIKKED